MKSSRGGGAAIGGGGGGGTDEDGCARATFDAVSAMHATPTVVTLGISMSSAERRLLLHQPSPPEPTAATKRGDRHEIPRRPAFPPFLLRSFTDGRKLVSGGRAARSRCA